MAALSRFSPIFVAAGILALAGCQNGAGPFAAKSPEPPEGAATVAAPTFVEQDVDAPDVFGATESGLWDGRPSLGGVWVAHPDVADPERVRIRNEANGKTVIGALFRREREVPGPRFQVSSDAAEVLGVLAGQPTTLDVVAIRRETIEVPGEVPPDMDAPDLDDGADVAEAATAALATPAPEDGQAGPEDGAAAGIDTSAETEPATAEAKPRRPRWWPFGRRNRAPAPPQAAAGEITATELAPLAAAGSAGGEAETQPAQASAATAAVAAPAPEAAPPAESKLREPYVQIGIFSVEGNAAETADALRAAGLIPSIREENADGKRYWRVVVGPATTSRDRRTILKQVRDLGFEDAYFVKN